MTGQQYYFWLVGQRADRLYLGRNNRINSHDSPKSGPHFACRFNLGLISRSIMPSQTWSITHHDSLGEVTNHPTPIEWNSDLGLTVGGSNQDLFQPNNKDRRVLTSRRGDWNVVVSWWGPDERTRLVHADDEESRNLEVECLALTVNDEG